MAQHREVAGAYWNHELSPTEDFIKYYNREKTLVRKDDIDGEGYAACRTYRRTGWAKRPGHDGLKDGFVYGISSVVTPPQHYRRGYATYMLSLLHLHLQPPSSIPSSLLPLKQDELVSGFKPGQADELPVALGSWLTSDVGSTFYSKCSLQEGRKAWVVNDSQNSGLKWAIKPTAPDFDEDKVEWIYRPDIESLSKELSTREKARLAEADVSKGAIWAEDPASTGALAFLPVKSTWYDPSCAPHPVGVRIKTGTPAEDPIVLFLTSFFPIGFEFLVTLISKLTPEYFPLALQAFDKAASDAGRERGFIWGLDPFSEIVEAWKNQPGREVEVKKRAEAKGGLMGTVYYGEEGQEGRMLDGQMWHWL
ncbi:hypothetical protein L202_04704 [Cryptococcus amylolentus CBS 6039]|uniref:N-acetyltransferase domain-containing protein n=1 Tax=Cryptococcus amylolentus CBS 6039 TaxID=1295533 RepID=A0A1E3HQ12_9TREE|nr:hypothetical protein L202_04704 [Cryptococcus amylolentus CBS 6039]ODN77531.1 hypothetical protein L202_04704 [Cryptococcus amylolentus CBS 6039]